MLEVSACTCRLICADYTHIAHSVGGSYVISGCLVCIVSCLELKTNQFVRDAARVCVVLSTSMRISVRVVRVR